MMFEVYDVWLNLGLKELFFLRHEAEQRLEYLCEEEEKCRKQFDELFVAKQFDEANELLKYGRMLRELQQDVLFKIEHLTVFITQRRNELLWANFVKEKYS